MNFEAFAKSVERAYPLAKERNPDCYSLDESMAVFSCYFEAYQQHIGQDHPPLKVRQIANIISTMDFSIDEYYRTIDYAPADYPALIEQYFKTRYRRCDYNINHFFSGRIRELRFYEACL